MPKDKAELMKRLRDERRSAGLKEVRGIWKQEVLHEKIKLYAAKLK